MKELLDVIDKITKLATGQQQTMELLANKVFELQDRVAKLEQMPRKIVKSNNDFPEGYPYK